MINNINLSMTALLCVATGENLSGVIRFFGPSEFLERNGTREDFTGVGLQLGPHMGMIRDQQRVLVLLSSLITNQDSKTRSQQIRHELGCVNTPGGVSGSQRGI